MILRKKENIRFLCNHTKNINDKFNKCNEKIDAAPGYYFMFRIRIDCPFAAMLPLG